MLRNPRLLAFLLLAVGLGLVGWYGEARWNSPEWTGQQMEDAVDVRLALELQRRGALLQPSAGRLDQLRAIVRSEVEAEIRRGRAELERWIFVGAMLCMLGAGHFAKALVAARRRLN